MVPEARLEQTEHGLVPKGEGWFVINAHEATWWTSEGRGAYSDLEGEPEFGQVGVHLVALDPEDQVWYRYRPSGAWTVIEDP